MATLDSESRAHASKATSLPPSTQFAIITALPNIVNGAFWGFTTVEDAKEHAEVLKTDANITARKLGNACLIEVNPDYLIKAVSLVDKNLITAKDKENMQRGMAEAYADFEKFLANKGEKNFSGIVGIYCVNDSTSINYKGKSYPSFRISINRALELLNKWGYMIKVNGSYVTPQQAMQNGKALFNSMILSPTNTGLFIDIKSTFEPERIKAMKKQLKANTKG